MALKDPKMCKQSTAGKRKHVTSTITQKLEIIEVWKRQNSKRGYGAIQHWLFNYLFNEETDTPITII